MTVAFCLGFCFGIFVWVPVGAHIDRQLRARG